MINDIYSDKVFDQQANGTVFYKESAKVMDLPAVGPGIYESWRYNFDAGKMTFRAVNSDKVFEKRLIKDSYGVPKWTTWMEIVPGEAHGVMAVSINNGILKLPNEDGALKLEITPALLNVFSRTETEKLIDQKIYETQSSQYTFLPWDERFTKAIDIVKDAFPNGGVTQHLYIVNADPSIEGEKLTTSFIWDIVQKINKQAVYGFIDVNSPQPTSLFTPFSLFELHIKDVDTEYPDTLHISRDDKTKIAKSLQSSVYETFKEDHLLNKSKSPLSGIEVKHVDDTQIQLWNHKLEDVSSPEAGMRYINYSPTGSHTQWVKSLEQLDMKIIPDTVIDEPFGSGDHIISSSDFTFTKTWSPLIKMLVSAGNSVESLKITFSSINTYNHEAFFEYNHNPSTRSVGFRTDGPIPNSYEVNVPVLMGRDGQGDPIYIDTIKFISNPPKNAMVIRDLKFTLSYRSHGGAVFGYDVDTDVNIIGKTIKFNGTVIDNNSAKTAEWGGIYGSITKQNDLIKYLDDAAFGKLDWAPRGGSNVRYDVINEQRFVASLVQHSGFNPPNVPFILWRASQILPTPGNNALVKNGFAAAIQAAITDPTKLRDAEILDVVIKCIGFNIPSYMSEVWFFTDDNDSFRSPVVQNPGEGNTATLEWHLGPHTNFDSILVGNPPADGRNAFTQFNDTKIEIYYTSYNGVEVGPITNDKQITIHSKARPTVIDATLSEEKHIAYYEETFEKVSMASFDSTGGYIASKISSRLYEPDNMEYMVDSVNAKTDAVIERAIHFITGSGLHISLDNEIVYDIDNIKRFGPRYKISLDNTQSFDTIRSNELTGQDGSLIIKDRRTELNAPRKAWYFGNETDPLVIRAPQAPAGIDGFKVPSNHIVAVINGQEHLLANYQDVADAELGNVMLLTDDQTVQAGIKTFMETIRVIDIDSRLTDGLDYYELISFNPIYPVTDQRDFVRVGDTRIPLLLKSKQAQGDPAVGGGHLKIMVNNSYNWLANYSDHIIADEDIKSKIGWSIIPGINDPIFNPNNSLQFQISQITSRFDNFFLKANVDGSVDDVYPVNPVRTNVPSSRLVKVYIDAETTRAKAQENAIQTLVQQKEDIANKAGTWPTVVSTATYPSTQAVKQYIDTISATTIASKVDKASVPIQSDGRKWIVTNAINPILDSTTNTLKHTAADVDAISPSTKDINVVLSAAVIGQPDIAGHYTAGTGYAGLMTGGDKFKLDKYLPDARGLHNGTYALRLVVDTSGYAHFNWENITSKLVNS